MYNLVQAANKNVVVVVVVEGIFLALLTTIALREKTLHPPGRKSLGKDTHIK